MSDWTVWDHHEILMGARYILKSSDDSDNGCIPIHCGARMLIERLTFCCASNSLVFTIPWQRFQTVPTAAAPAVELITDQPSQDPTFGGQHPRHASDARARWRKPPSALKSSLCMRPSSSHVAATEPLTADDRRDRRLDIRDVASVTMIDLGSGCSCKS